MSKWYLVVAIHEDLLVEIEKYWPRSRWSNLQETLSYLFLSKKLLDWNNNKWRKFMPLNPELFKDLSCSHFLFIFPNFELKGYLLIGMDKSSNNSIIRQWYGCLCILAVFLLEDRWILILNLSSSFCTCMAMLFVEISVWSVFSFSCWWYLAVGKDWKVKL